jgi:Transposase zinc-binding domain
MPRPALEVADIFRDHGAAWRAANAGHVSLGQLKVMSAIEDCRTAALGGHVVRCENAACGYTAIAYNSCLMGPVMGSWRRRGPHLPVHFCARTLHNEAPVRPRRRGH